MIAGSSANPAARTESLPAAITGIAPLLQAYSTASQNAQPSVAWRAPPPSERLMTSAPRSAAQRMPAATSAAVPVAEHPFAVHRSEEHTSELQSLMRISYAVFCLKKKKHHTHNTYIHKQNTLQ